MRPWRARADDDVGAVGVRRRAVRTRGGVPAAARAGRSGLALWGLEEHVRERFAAAGATPSIAREVVEFQFESPAEAVRAYAEYFGPFVAARAALEPQGRWEELLGELGKLIARFDAADDGTGRLPADYFVILVER